MATKQSDNTHSLGLLQGTAYNRLYKNLTHVLLPYNLTLPEWKLLGQLYDHGNLRLSKLSDYLDYDPPMVTKLTKLLANKNYVKREYDKSDERAKVIVLTKQGSDALKKSDGVIQKKLSEILQGLSPHDIKTYIAVLRVIASNTQ